MDSLFGNSLLDDVSGFSEPDSAVDSGVEIAGRVIVQSWPSSFHTFVSDYVYDVSDHVDLILGSIGVAVELTAEKVSSVLS